MKKNQAGIFKMLYLQTCTFCKIFFMIFQDQKIHEYDIISMQNSLKLAPLLAKKNKIFVDR